MDDHKKKLLPRFRYGEIRPRAHEELQRGPCYQLYRLVPLDVMELSTGLGLENYTPEGVEKAVKNYWRCVELLAKEGAQVIVFGGANLLLDDGVLAWSVPHYVVAFGLLPEGLLVRSGREAERVIPWGDLPGKRRKMGNLALVVRPKGGTP